MTESDAIRLDTVVDEELAYIYKHRYYQPPKNPNEGAIPKPAEDDVGPRDIEDVRRSLVGLALSGGGIRSATTNLGILQAMSRMNILPLVDYVSTVSGGGYIGACLSSLLSWNGKVANAGADPSSPFLFEPTDRPVFATDWERFPFRTELREGWPRRAGSDLVAHLRTHGNFLVARWGLFRRETMRSIGTLLTGIAYHVLLFLVTLFAVSSLIIALALVSAPSAHNVLADLSARDAAAALSAKTMREPVARTALIAEDSAVARVSQIACPPNAAGCVARVTMGRPSLWQRLAWNVEVVRRVFAKSWYDWRNQRVVQGSRVPQWARLPGPFLLLFWALVVGMVLSVLTLLWMRLALKRYLRGDAAKVALPKRGESDEDAFERRVLWRLGGVVIALLVIAVFVRGLAFSVDRIRTKLPAIELTDRDQLVWLFAPLAIAVGARVGAFVIAILGESYSSRWTRRARSLWGAYQAITTYGIWVTLLFALLPFAIYALSDHTGGVGLGALTAFALTRFLTSRATNGEGNARLRLRVPPAIRNALLGAAVAVLLLLGILYFGAVIVRHIDNLTGAALVALGGIAAFGLVGWTVNQNKLSPHSFYKDRLAETYLFSQLADNEGRVRVYRDALEMPLSRLHGDACTPATRDINGPWRNTAPYHLVSAAINLAGSRDLTRKDRKSGYWLFSKLFCGSVHTGFRKTGEYRGGETKLARAIAVSGAAAASAAGQFTFFAQAFATVLFNVRLGNWIENPMYPSSLQRQERKANWMDYLWRELTMDTVETTHLVNLSDGGHTGDNVGIYPLLQRRCKVIIACDAEGDGSLSFGSFTEALRHAYIDMGIDVDIDLTLIRPDPVTGLSRSHCAVGRIRYPDRPYQESFLIYLKNSLTGDEPEPVLNYKSRVPAFPHESTIDQFFDDAQFESYRALGVHIAEHTFGRWVRSSWFPVVQQRHRPTVVA